MSYIRVRKHYVHVPYLVLGLIEFFLLFMSFSVVEGIQERFQIVSEARITSAVLPSLAYAFLLSCCSLAMGVYLALMQEGFWAMFFRTLVAYCFLGSISITFLSLIWPSMSLGSSNLLWLIMVSTGLAMIARRVFAGIIDSDQLSRRVLVLGTGQSAAELQTDYEKHRRSLSVRVLGYVGSKGEAISDKDCIDVPTDWVAFCQQNRISEIIVAKQQRRQSDAGSFPLNDLIDCKLAGIDVVNAVTFYERELTQIKLNLVQPSWIIFSEGFKVSYSRDLTKRLFDLTISVLLAAILLPFVSLAALLVFLETGRPILYSQTRVGKDGKPFKIYKIRSMTQDAEKGGKAVWASANDSRITRVGAFIRNTRLDEIPQLWNVLKGDMSFVGPRPERPEFVTDLNEQIPFYAHRHVVKPGLMGWAQLNYPYGASVEDARGKLEYDLYYTKNHSIVMDLLIMIQAVSVKNA